MKGNQKATQENQHKPPDQSILRKKTRSHLESFSADTITFIHRKERTEKK